MDVFDLSDFDFEELEDFGAKLFRSPVIFLIIISWL